MQKSVNVMAEKVCTATKVLKAKGINYALFINIIVLHIALETM